jgi:hypothetical protein
VHWPGVIVAVLVVLIVSQLLYAFAPYRRRDFLLVLALTAAGVALGQLWDLLGLPSLRLGEANLVPALIFAFGLQPLVDRLPRPWAR